jgi:hypothetical protein
VRIIILSNGRDGFSVFELRRFEVRRGMKKALSGRQRYGATVRPWHPLVQCRRTRRPSASVVRMRGVLPIGSLRFSQRRVSG